VGTSVALLVALAGTIVVACYDVPKPDCGFVCGPGGACPDAYTCAADDGESFCPLGEGRPPHIRTNEHNPVGSRNMVGFELHAVELFSISCTECDG